MNFTTKLILPVILLFTLTFIESLVFFLPLTTLYIVILSIYQKDMQVFPLAFLGGLSIDILQVETLGTTSAIFLIMIFIISLYKRKIASSSPIFIGLAVLLSSTLYSYFVGQGLVLALFQGMLLTFLVLVVSFLVRPIFMKNNDRT